MENEVVEEVNETLEIDLREYHEDPLEEKVVSDIFQEYEKTMMEDLLKQAKSDHKFYNKLKTFAQQAENTALFHHLRDIEADVFPSTEYDKEARAKGAKLNLVFRMVEMNMPDNFAWMVHRVMKRFWKRGGNFDLQDASELIAERKKIFGE